MNSNLIVPLDSLPDDPAERHATLRGYFCDKDATATRTPSGWDLTLYWPSGEKRHVDPNLAEGLVWWGNSVSLSTMITGSKREGKILQVLYDSWTLLSWSQWLAKQESSERCPLILHVDDHRDLAAPRLVYLDNVLVDGITGAPCDLRNPETVAACILSGAIGMGSFMTPFLHWFPNAEVRHLCQPPKVTETVDKKFSLDVELDTFLHPGLRRPAISLHSQSSHTSGPGYLRSTPFFDDWLRDLDPKDSRPILLHIDMDYFNNRYDGDSDWEERALQLNPLQDQVISQIDLFCAAISGAGIGARIEDIVVAYSPGFFPGELWAVASNRLISGLMHAVGQ